MLPRERREGSSSFKDGCDARHPSGPAARPAAPPPAARGSPAPQPSCSEGPAALSASPRPERPAASCAPSSTTSGGHDQDFAHSARKQRRKARHRHFAGSQKAELTRRKRPRFRRDFDPKTWFPTTAAAKASGWAALLFYHCERLLTCLLAFSAGSDAPCLAAGQQLNLAAQPRYVGWRRGARRATKPNRGPTSRARRSPPQEPSETSTPPRRRGAPGGKARQRRPYFTAQRPS